MLGEDDIDAFTRFQLDVTSTQAVSETIADRGARPDRQGPYTKRYWFCVIYKGRLLSAFLLF